MKLSTSRATIASVIPIVFLACWTARDAVSEVDWTVSLTANSADPLADPVSLSLGVSSSATSGFDFGLDVPAPPAPPASIKLDVCFPCSHEFVKRLSTDIRESANVVNWDIHARADEDDFVLEWDVSSVPGTMYVIMEIGEDPIDMRENSSHSFSAGVYDFMIAVDENDPPVITSSPITTATEDTLYTYDVEATDVDINDVLTYSLTTSPSGMTIDAETGLIQWIPTNDQVGDNSIKAQVEDTAGAKDTQSFTIAVANVNDPPTAHDQSVITDEDNPVAITLTGSDIDGDPITYHVASSPSNGSLTGTPPNLTYTPHLNFNGADSFTFKVNDGSVDSNTANVEIIVGDVEGYFLREMKHGWNLVSLPVQPLDPEPEAVLVSISRELRSLWTFHPDEGWSVYIPGAHDNLEKIEAGRGYCINMDQPGTLIVHGTAPKSTAISLCGGEWNLVGYSCLDFRDVEECMQRVRDDINSVWEYDPATGWSIYAPDEMNSLGVMKPGYGYWIKADRNCTWNVNSGNPP